MRAPMRLQCVLRLAQISAAKWAVIDNGVGGSVGSMAPKCAKECVACVVGGGEGSSVVSK